MSSSTEIFDRNFHGDCHNFQVLSIPGAPASSSNVDLLLPCFNSTLYVYMYHPSSQGWASRCPLLYMLVCLGYGWVDYFSFLSVF